MLKRDLFVAAMKAGRYQELGWIVTAFAMTKDTDSSTLPYPYRLVPNPLGMHYCDPASDGPALPIEDAVMGEPLYRFKDKLTVGPGDIPNLHEEIETTYGNFLFNWIVMVYSFGDKLPYQTGSVSAGKLEKLILRNFKDTPQEPSERKPDEIYVDEYLRFAKAMYFLTGMTQLCVWAATKKTMLPPPGIQAFREKLLAENEGHLHEMATIAKIDAELVKFDAAYLKGDPGGDNFISDFKSRNIVRKKLFLMHGAEMSLDDNTVNATLIRNSLSEGWDITKFPEMNNSLRAGSFNRGAETELGGVSVKWLLRASSNINVTEDDCGSTVGGVIDVDASNLHKLVGFSAITKQGSVRVNTLEEAGTYLGKRVMMRNPMYCKLTLTDYCKVCVGERLNVTPTGLSIAVSAYGSAFLSLFMAASHGKALSLAKMDIKTAIT